jgi:hypothetical protein
MGRDAWGAQRPTPSELMVMLLEGALAHGSLRDVDELVRHRPPP